MTWLTLLPLLAAAAPAGPRVPAPTDAPVTVALPEGDAALTAVLDLPEGRKLSDEAPSTWHAMGRDGVAAEVDGPQPLTDTTLVVPLLVGSEGTLALDLTVYHCTASDCRASRVDLEVPIRVDLARDTDTPAPTVRIPVR